MTCDVAIVGGGICGLSIGWRLAKRGLKVSIAERGEPGRGATWAAAGVLFPRVGDDSRGPAFTKLCLESQKRWPNFARDLEAESGVKIGYSREGMLSPAFNAGEEAQLTKEHLLLRKLRVGAKWIAREELRSLETHLSRAARSALFNPLVHQVDNRKVALALKKVFVAVGDLREYTPVDEVLIRKGRVTGIRTGDDEIRSNIVVLAAGAWSAAISGLPEETLPPVRPVKGQMMSVTVPEKRPLLSHLIHYDDKFMIQRRDGRLLIGATVEEGRSDTRVTAGAMFGLLAAALKVLPNIRLLPIGETWAGVRPGSPDGVPILGPTSVKGLVMATGHFRSGILLGPITADVISEYVASGRLPELAEAFTLRRFNH